MACAGGFVRSTRESVGVPCGEKLFPAGRFGGAQGNLELRPALKAGGAQTPGAGGSKELVGLRRKPVPLASGSFRCSRHVMRFLGPGSPTLRRGQCFGSSGVSVAIVQNCEYEMLFFLILNYLKC